VELKQQGVWVVFLKTPEQVQKMVLLDCLKEVRLELPLMVLVQPLVAQQVQQVPLDLR
jgi:hypothetical protein